MAIRYSKSLYLRIPKLIDENPIWANEMFSRLRKYYEYLEFGFFPEDETGSLITAQFYCRGFKLIYN